MLPPPDDGQSTLQDTFDATGELAAHSRRMGVCIGIGLGAGAAMGNVLDILPVGILCGVAVGFGAIIVWERRARPTGP
ncbi:MAG: hypothetical protein EXR51_06755 [Dehalococcoidia bacterium]|nr:hypothetical protein [Dehalococcoidia bacterium]